jgi:transcriptional regulator with XRE-family HTH domain
MGSAQPGPTLAEKLSQLVATVHEPGRGPYSTREIADAINLRHGRSVISHSTVANLLSGKQTNPTKAVLELLAEFFHVPVAYFFDDATAAEVSADLQLIAALRDAGVREVALRVAGLDDDARHAITTMIDALYGVRRQPSAHGSQHADTAGGDDAG